MTAEHIVRIHKMQGCGNDFVFIDNRSLQVPVDVMPTWAKTICRQHFGVGADGLVFLDTPPKNDDVDYVWHFYNADGSRAEMCGNASRCVALLAVELGFAGTTHSFRSDAGPIQAVAYPEKNEAKVELPPAHDLALHIPFEMDGEKTEIHFVNTGVPHAVFLHADAASLDVKTLGAFVRYHTQFAPAGTNANFMSVLDNTHIHLRTYERGVEDETYACGTGAAAGALIAHKLGLTGPEVSITTSGGEVLGISLEDERVFLTGKAVKIYTADMNLNALNLSMPLPTP